MEPNDWTTVWRRILAFADAAATGADGLRRCDRFELSKSRTFVGSQCNETQTYQNKIAFQSKEDHPRMCVFGTDRNMTKFVIDQDQNRDRTYCITTVLKYISLKSSVVNANKF